MFRIEHCSCINTTSTNFRPLERTRAPTEVEALCKFYTISV